MRAVRLALLTLAGVLALTPAAGALDIEQDDQPPDGEVGTPYEFQFTAQEGCLPYRFSFLTGNLPPGLRVTQEGLLTGTPTQAGVFQFYVGVDDSAIAPCRGSPQSQGLFTMKVLPDLAVATTSLPRGQPGQPYSTTLVAANPEPGWELRWSVVSGAFPPGLTLSPTGVISGTPAAAGKWAVVVRVEEKFRRWGERELVFVVAAPLTLGAPRAQVGEVGIAYRSSLSPVGGLGPMAFSVASGSLPPGLALDPVTGIVQGTPTGAGRFPATFAVTDSGGERATVDSTLVVASRLAVSAKALPKARAGKRYATKLRSTGGVAPVSWRVAAGRLPKGLALDTRGRIRGIPSAAGTAHVTVEARDRLGARARRSLSLTVTA